MYVKRLPSFFHKWIFILISKHDIDNFERNINNLQSFLNLSSSYIEVWKHHYDIEYINFNSIYQYSLLIYFYIVSKIMIYYNYNSISIYFFYVFVSFIENDVVLIIFILLLLKYILNNVQPL